MSQKTTGIRAILSLPFVYKFFQALMGKKDSRKMITDDHIKPQDGDVVLDVGCGAADYFPYMPTGSSYIGVDLSAQYIDDAIKKYSDSGKFINKDVNDVDFSELGTPDVILLMGVMHHLDDDELESLFESLKKISHSKTRLVTLDGCFRKGQNIIAKMLISMDRGQNVRDANGYSTILKKSYGSVNLTIREDLTRFPYTFAIFEAKI